MSLLTLRLVAPDGALADTREFEVAAVADAWREVAAEAQAFAAMGSARIRVSDQNGGIVILTSVAAALLADQLPSARRTRMPALRAVA